MSQDDRIAIFTAPDEQDVLTWVPPSTNADVETMARQIDGSIDETTFEDCKRAAAMLRALVHERDDLLNLRVERHEYERMKRDKQEALDHYSRVRAENAVLREDLDAALEKIARHNPTKI